MTYLWLPMSLSHTGTEVGHSVPVEFLQETWGGTRGTPYACPTGTLIHRAEEKASSRPFLKEWDKWDA